MEVVLVAIISALSAIILALLGMYGSRKLGIGATQQQLVENLKDIVETQKFSIADLEKKAQEQDRKINFLETKVRELSDLTIQQAALIKKLMSKRKIIIQNGTNDEISSDILER